jgi:ABC-2 type transport system permease protein
VGAVGSTQRYAQQLSGLVTFPATLPFLGIPLLLDQPDGAVARVLTYLPFTAPITGMLRAAAGALPWWEFALSSVALALWTAVSIRICSRIFRVALLATGNTPSLSQLWRWTREAR